MPFSPRTWAATSCAVAMLAVALPAVAGCSAGNPSTGGGDPIGAVPGSADLAAALSTVPAVTDGRVMFADWALLGHRAGKDARNTLFAGQLLDVDDGLQRDLGIRSTDADWELDLWQAGRPATVVLHFPAGVELGGVPARAEGFGYRAEGPVATGRADSDRMWTLPLTTIGVDAGRGLLVGGPDAAQVRTVLAGPPQPLGRTDAVMPLLDLAAGRLPRITTATIAVGSQACVSLAAIISRGRATPELIDAVRKQFPGTFTPPQAELTAVGDPAGATALAGLTFPDTGTAKANQPNDAQSW